MPLSVWAGQSDTTPVPVTVENFIRAESDRYFGAVVKQGGFGKLFHRRVPRRSTTSVDRRPDEPRHALYSIVVDLGRRTGDGHGTGRPDSGGRFMSMQVFDEDEYVVEVAYGGSHTYTPGRRPGTRYILIGFRTLADPDDPADLKKVHALQDAIKVEQKTVGPLRAAAVGRGEPEEGARCAGGAERNAGRLAAHVRRARRCRSRSGAAADRRRRAVGRQSGEGRHLPAGHAGAERRQDGAPA
ncbi:MAG: hypothetical protein WDM81_02440 [Rhizomicrobium sp.]